MKSKDLIAVIESCYRADVDTASWIRNLHESLVPILDHGMGTLSYRYDLHSEYLTVHETVERNALVGVQVLLDQVRTVTSEYISKWRVLPAGTTSEVPGFDEQNIVKEFFRPAGVADCLVINVVDPQGVGIWAGGLLPKKMKLSARARSPLNHLAAHIASGYRLHSRLARENASPSAVFSSSGKLLHAEDDAKDARIALAAAARAIDKARGKLRRTDPDEAVSRWRGLVSARWSLVDQFESDGKRYLVAKANAARGTDVAGLTEREGQVVAHAALGHHNKLIAYELGIAASTVRVLLGRAARKLEASTRDELVEKYADMKSKAKQA